MIPAQLVPKTTPRIYGSDNMTTEYIDYRDMFFSMADDTEANGTKNYFYFAIPLPRMPAFWQDVKQEGYSTRFNYNFQVRTDNTDTTIDIEIRVAGQTSTIEIEGTADTDPNWVDDVDMSGYPKANERIPIGTGYVGTSPEFALVRISIDYSMDGETDIAELFSAYLRQRYDSTVYNGHVTGINRDGDAIAVPDVSFLYGPDMPVSAWHVRYVLIQSLNKYLFESIGAFSIPMYGEMDHEVVV